MNQKQIDRFFTILSKELNAPARAILTGAGAGALLGHVRPSMDLDFQINPKKKGAWKDVDKAVSRAIQETGIQANYADNIDRWGMISLLDYERTASRYKKFNSLAVLLMDPVYWAIGKLTRYLEPDRLDVRAVFKKQKPSLARVLRVWRAAVQKSPRSLAQKTFLDNASHFLQSEGKGIWGKTFNSKVAADRLVR